MLTGDSFKIAKTVWQNSSQADLKGANHTEEEPFGQNYGPLTPTKWKHHGDRLKLLLEERAKEITPVTVHLVPTIRCNHFCYFCTYGGAKGSCCGEGDSRPVANQEELRIQQKDMPFPLMQRILDELAEVNVRGVIFTGGGEPTLYRDLARGMKYCADKDISFSMNTNGRGLRDEFLDQVIPLNPTYIRVSLNAGSPIIQQLVTGVDDFEFIVSNFGNMIRKKRLYSSPVDLSIGFVVNVVNVGDIMNITRRMRELEKELEAEGIVGGIYNIQFRPVGNYESSKNYSQKRIQAIVDHLRQTSGEEEAQSFLRFMYEEEQCTAEVLNRALEIMDKEAIPFLRACGSKIQIVYPLKKYQDLPAVTHKPYKTCRILPWFLFIWPDGTVYPCVEWAGTPGFEIGNLAQQSLQEILTSSARTEKFNCINKDVIHSRCAPICAHHEMNILMEDVAKRIEAGGSASVKNEIEQQICHAEVKHRDFL